MPTRTAAERLVEAQDALHDLSLGRGVRVLVDQNGERIEYTATSTGKLRSYITQLQQEIEVSSRPLNGPLRVVF